jgi:hypothetical protein
VIVRDRGYRHCDDTDSVEPFVVKPKAAWKMLGCGNTHGYELLAVSEVESFKAGPGPALPEALVHPSRSGDLGSFGPHCSTLNRLR